MNLFRSLSALFYTIAILISSAIALWSQPKNTDPDPEEFLMMDTGVEIDRKSLAANFVYPKEAKQYGYQGTVNVHVMVDVTGKATRFIVKTPVHPLLDSAAVQAVMRCNYTPAMYDGKKMKSWITIPIIFTLGKNVQPQTVSIPSGATEDKDDSDGYVKPKYDRMNFIKNIKYPREAIDAGMECTASFMVSISSEGKVTDIKEQSNCPKILSDEAKRVISETVFEPALKSGKPVDDKIRISVPFFIKK